MRKALIVGVNDYPDSPLNFCVDDARAVNELLLTNEDGSENFETILLTDSKDVCRDSLQTHIDAVFDGEADVALFYFAGHGYCKGKENYIATPDASASIPGIKLSDINAVIQQSRCKNKIVILDSCFSGQFGESPFTASSSSLSEGVTILASSRKYETSAEDPDLGHGLFTYLLLECLKGKSADILGNVTPTSVYAFIDRYLGAWHQRPIFKTNVQQFISLRKVNPSVDVAELRKLKDLFDDESDEFALDPSFEFTNTPEKMPKLVEPYANENNVRVLKMLQRFERVGLIEPVGVEHMYEAAMQSKNCRLTPLGQYYWSLAQRRKV